MNRSAMLLFRRLLSIAIIMAALLPKWGVYDYSSASNLPPSRDHDFTGLKALAQQFQWILLMAAISSLCWLIFSTFISKHKQFSPYGSITTIERKTYLYAQGWRWDFAVMGIGLSCVTVWIVVLINAISGYKSGGVGFWYKDLLGWFWLFPAALLAAAAIRFMSAKS